MASTSAVMDARRSTYPEARVRVRERGVHPTGSVYVAAAVHDSDILHLVQLLAIPTPSKCEWWNVWANISIPYWFERD